MGITKQHDHEKARRRGRAHNPGYLARFQEEGDRFDRGGAATARPHIADIRNLGALASRIHVADTTKIAQLFEARARAIPFLLRGFAFSLKFTPLQFASANADLSPARAKSLYPELYKEATQRLEMTKRRLVAAPAVPRPEISSAGKTRVRPYRTFKTFLTPAHREPWDRLCKELRLSPIDHDPHTAP